MSVGDDDDFWENDDFIATIENVVKKAEQASAAKHGTQTAATPASNPLQIGTNARSVGGPVLPSPASRVETLTAQQTFNVRPTNGYSAPGQEFSGTTQHLLSGENGNAKRSGSNGFRPLYEQHGQTPVQSKNHENASLVHQEGAQYRELLAEKDGAISVLRSRVRQAEQQLDEIRRKTSQQSTSYAALNQQRELERLSSQLMFKDNEISEAQRARAEKEELLKNALVEATALKEELEGLKKSRQTVAEFKRPRDEVGVLVPERNGECSGIVRSTPKISRQGHDPWSPPWVPEKTLNGLQEKVTAEYHSKNVSEDAAKVSGGLNVQEEPLIPDTLQMRVAGNGCVSSDGSEASKANKVQGIGAASKASKPHRRDTPETSGTGTRVGGDGGRSSAVQDLESSSMCEMYYSLQQLWGFKDAKRDRMSVVPQIYATCSQDLYILLYEKDSRSKSQDSGNKEGTATGTASEKLHTALAKVSNGFAHPEILMPLLLEFCRVDNANVVGSALRVLHCILHVDSSCRQKLLAGGSQRADHEVQLPHSRESLGKTDDGLLVRSAPKVTSSDRTSQVPVFSSVRILFHPEAVDKSGNKDIMSKDTEGCGSQTPNRCDHLQQPDLRRKQVTFAGDSAPPVEENPFVKWILHLALTSSSPLVKFEAVALIGFLVVNSEPVLERASFEHLLHSGGIELLLRESCGVEIQLQAIRIVHLLLHCPILFQKFLILVESHDKISEPRVINDNEVGLAPEVQADKHPNTNRQDHDRQMGQRLETCDPMIMPALLQSSHPESSQVKLLDGITECLMYTESSLQGHALHRSAIRLLAFIAASRDTGATLLTQPGQSYDDPELGSPWKMEGEAASGQQIVGDVSDLIHLKVSQTRDWRQAQLVVVDDEITEKKLGKVLNIPQRLVVLLNAELEIDEQEARIEPSLKEERDCLVQEALTLLCQLSSHVTHSSKVVGHLISNKALARLTLSVMDRLIRRKSPHSQLGQKSQVPRNSDTAELARSLRKRVLRSLADCPDLV